MKKSEKEINHSLKALANSSVIVMIGIFLSKVFSYLYRIIIAKYYGVEIYGLFSLGTMIAGFLGILALLGLGGGLIRFIPIFRGAGREDKARYSIKFSAKLVLISSLALGAILFIFSEFISIQLFKDPALISYLKIFSVLVPVSVMTLYFLTIINAYEKIGWYTLIEYVARNFSNVLFIGILVLFGMSNLSVPWSFLLGNVSILLISYFVMKRTLRKSPVDKNSISEEEKREMRKKILYYSVPLLFFGMVQDLFVWIDSFSIGYLKGTAEVGLYNAAAPIAMLLSISPLLFIRLFFPIITKRYAQNKKEFVGEISKQVSKWIFLINLPVFALIIMTPGAFLNILFGSDYLPAEMSLRVLAIGALFLSLSKVPNRLIEMTGKSKILLADIIIALGLNFILNFTLIPMPTVFGMSNDLGITGAAVATTISNIFLVVLFFIQARYYTSINPIRRKMLNLTVAAVIASAIFVFVKDRITLNVTGMIFLCLTFGLVYVLFVFLFGCLDRNDFMVIKGMLKSSKNLIKRPGQKGEKE